MSANRKRPRSQDPPPPVLVNPVHYADSWRYSEQSNGDRMAKPAYSNTGYDYDSRPYDYGYDKGYSQDSRYDPYYNGYSYENQPPPPIEPAYADPYYNSASTYADPRYNNQSNYRDYDYNRPIAQPYDQYDRRPSAQSRHSYSHAAPTYDYNYNATEPPAYDRVSYYDSYHQPYPPHNQAVNNHHLPPPPPPALNYPSPVDLSRFRPNIKSLGNVFDTSARSRATKNFAMFGTVLTRVRPTNPTKKLVQTPTTDVIMSSPTSSVHSIADRDRSRTPTQSKKLSSNNLQEIKPQETPIKKDESSIELTQSPEPVKRRIRDADVLKSLHIHKELVMYHLSYALSELGISYDKSSQSPRPVTTNPSLPNNSPNTPQQASNIASEHNNKQQVKKDVKLDADSHVSTPRTALSYLVNESKKMVEPTEKSNSMQKPRKPLDDSSIKPSPHSKQTNPVTHVQYDNKTVHGISRSTSEQSAPARKPEPPSITRAVSSGYPPHSYPGKPPDHQPSYSSAPSHPYPSYPPNDRYPEHQGAYGMERGYWPNEYPPSNTGGKPAWNDGRTGRHSFDNRPRHPPTPKHPPSYH